MGFTAAHVAVTEGAQGKLQVLINPGAGLEFHKTIHAGKKSSNQMTGILLRVGCAVDALNIRS
jgi:hypothetical protein